MFISEAFAQAAPAATATDGPMGALGGLGGMLPLVLMFVVLYFVMIRPQMKRQKEHKAMIDALAKGDEVVTSGGVLGKVSKMGDTFVGVEIPEARLHRVAVVLDEIGLQPGLVEDLLDARRERRVELDRDLAARDLDRRRLAEQVRQRIDQADQQRDQHDRVLPERVSIHGRPPPTRALARPVT